MAGKLAKYVKAVEASLINIDNGMDAISSAADAAAVRACNGGKIYGLSDEEGFISELSYRAGGLVITSGAPASSEITGQDVILAATQDRALEDQRSRMRECREEGALVILIGSGASKLREECDLFIETSLPAGSAPIVQHKDALICPLAGVVHIAILWVFCLEFTMACVRRGKVPAFYQTGCLTAGSLRNSVHRTVPFHPEGEFRIDPIPAGEKGREYLANLHRCFGGIRATEWEKLEETGILAATTIESGHTVWCDSIGHHLPSQKGIEGDPEFFYIHFPESKDAVGPFKPGDIYIYNGYFFFPEEELAAARKAGVPSVWIMGGKEVESIYPQEGEIHINGYWRYGDASMRIPGYDIKVAPASGVVTTAMLWMLHAAAADGLEEQ